MLAVGRWGVERGAGKGRHSTVANSLILTNQALCGSGSDSQKCFFIQCQKSQILWHLYLVLASHFSRLFLLLDVILEVFFLSGVWGEKATFHRVIELFTTPTGKLWTRITKPFFNDASTRKPLLNSGPVLSHSFALSLLCWSLSPVSRCLCLDILTSLLSFLAEEASGTFLLSDNKHIKCVP